MQKAPRTILSDHQRLILINSVLGFQSFIGPVLVVFYTAYMGLTLQQFFFIDSLLFFLIALFELPSGYMADKLGRKRMLLISRIVTILAMGILLVVNNFIGALISTILTGIFAAMESGNAEAIYYESFSKEHREPELEKAYSIGGSASFISLIICSSLAGFLANIDLRIPVILDIVLLSASLYFIIAYLHDDRSSYRKAQKISFVTLVENKKAVWNVTPIFLLSGLFFMGIRGQAAEGFPAVTKIAYPMLQKLTADGVRLNDCGVYLLLNLMATIDDTNIINRSSLAVLRQVQNDISVFLSIGTAAGADVLFNQPFVHVTAKGQAFGNAGVDA